MRIRPILLLLVLSCCVSPCGAQAPMRHVNSRELVLGLDATSRADRVEAWLSQNDGQTWTPVAAELTGSRSVRLSVTRDGTYGIYLVLQNAGGRSAEAPAAGTQAHVRVTVDTTPPTLQVRKTTVSGGSGGTPQIEIRGVLLEESISSEGLRLFYRGSSKEPWRDGGVLDRTPERPQSAAFLALWPVPQDHTGRLDLMLVAADRAGNVAREEIRGVDLSAVQRMTASQPAPSGDADDPGSTPASDLKELGRTGGAAASAPSPGKAEPDNATIQNLQRATRARASAARFLAEGKFDLATARYEEALEAAPADAGLLAEVGSALFRANRLGDARKRFESSLQLDSRNTAAMEGMALVAAGEQRFTDARDQLRKLLDVDPKAGRIWLRYGDLEYRLGNRIEAFDAWDRVLAVSPMEPQIQASARDRLTTLRR